MARFRTLPPSTCHFLAALALLVVSPARAEISVVASEFEVEGFADSGPTDSHFVVDSLTGEVRFGPRLREPGGEERQYGRVPPRDRTIRFTRSGSCSANSTTGRE